MTKLGPVTRQAKPYETPKLPHEIQQSSARGFYCSDLSGGLSEDRPSGIKHAPPFARIRKFFNDSRLHRCRGLDRGGGVDPPLSLAPLDLIRLGLLLLRLSHDACCSLASIFCRECGFRITWAVQSSLIEHSGTHHCSACHSPVYMCSTAFSEVRITGHRQT
jgi:hypothetical protein